MERIGSFSPERFERVLKSTPERERFAGFQFERHKNYRRVANPSEPSSSNKQFVVSKSTVYAVPVVTAPIAPLIPLIQPQMAQNQLAPNGATWLVDNLSPIIFTNYHDMPKSPDQFCSIFHENDLNRIAEEHIKIFEDALRNRQIEYADVACRLFPYSLGEDAFYWFIHLRVSSIDSWEKLKMAFTGKYGIPITPTELYKQFVEMKRQGQEPINSFNNKFHKAFTRLQDPYVVSDASAREIYYSALDYLTSMFVRQSHPASTTLMEAYAKAMEISKGLGQNIAGPLLQLGPPAMPNQIQGIIQALAHQTPIMNQIS